MLKRKKDAPTAVEKESLFNIVQNDCGLHILSFILVGML